MIMRGADGKLSGFDIELGEDIADALDVKPDFISAGPSDDDIIDMVASGQADIGLSYLSESIEAAKRVFFSRPYLIQARTVFINRSKGMELEFDCPRLSDLRRLAKTPDSLGTLERSPYVKLIERTEADLEFKRFKDMESLAAAVVAGDIVASLQGELPAKYYLSRHPEATIRLKFCDVPGAQHRISIAVRPDGIDLLRWLDLYLAQRQIIIDLDTLLYRADRGVY